MQQSVRQRNFSMGIVPLFVLSVFVLGAAATFLWLRKLDSLEFFMESWRPILAGIMLVSALSLVNLHIRWIRWHFLLRKLNLLLRTKDSFLVYMGALPFLVTPFSLGELVRILMLRKSYPGSGGRIFITWVLERATDLLVLCVFILLALGKGELLLFAAALWTGVLFIFMGVYRRHGNLSPARAAYLVLVLLSFTVLSWVLPGIALSTIVSYMGVSPGVLDSLGAYSYGTVIGGISSVPLGVGVAGSLMVETLVDMGVSMQNSIVGTIVFRVGTSYFAVAFGLFIAAAFFGRLRQVVFTPEAGSHFDNIAEGYQSQFPAHIIERLIERKTNMMQGSLEDAGIPADAAGLDMGCGQGFYATRMAEYGYRMSGIDASQGQIVYARAYAESKGVEVSFTQADAGRLPFGDRSLDFAYAINIFHHIKTNTSKIAALEEIRRVLRPGGVFFLHEINTQNPVFRFYMNYVFPLIRTIDEGDEEWILSAEPPQVDCLKRLPDIKYFTFLPDFIPLAMLRPLARLEVLLENSRLGKYSAHFMVTFKKRDDETPEPL